MSQYLLFWEMEESKLPQETEARGAVVSGLLDQVKADQQKGKIKEWGAFLGGGKGFCLVEGEDTDIAALMHRYRPYVCFESQPYLSLSRVEDMLKGLAESKK